MSGVVSFMLEVRVVQTEGRPIGADRMAAAVAKRLRDDPMVPVPAVRAGKGATVAVLSAEPHAGA